MANISREYVPKITSLDSFGRKKPPERSQESLFEEMVVLVRAGRSTLGSRLKFVGC